MLGTREASIVSISGTGSERKIAEMLGFQVGGNEEVGKIVDPPSMCTCFVRKMLR